MRICTTVNSLKRKSFKLVQCRLLDDAAFFVCIFLELIYGRGYIEFNNLTAERHLLGGILMKQMTTEQLQQVLTESAIQLIDVRETDEYESGHIAEAKNVPLSELTERTDELDASRPVHIICLSGGRSMNAAMYLEQAGFDVTNVSGGMMSYEGTIV